MAIADKWVEVLSEWGMDDAWDMGNLVHTLENQGGVKMHFICQSHDQRQSVTRPLRFGSWMQPCTQTCPL